jgi:hypothetical protein
VKLDYEISLPPLRRIPLAPFAALACLVVLAVAVVALVLAGVAGRVKACTGRGRA